MANWYLLHYKIPSEPSAARVYIWRKLKRLGALLYQDAVWALPDTERNLEQLQWLSAEIVELGGEAALWSAQPVLSGQDDGIIQQLNRQVDRAYQELLDSMNSPQADLDALSRQYQGIKSRDFFNSQLGVETRQALLAARGAEE